MPSASPSPIKRPSLNERTSSAHSLSSSGRQATTSHKVHRPHVVTRHSRNVSHGKGLSRLGKVQSTASINPPEQQQQQHHQRKKSQDSTPPQSPRPSYAKRNSSHVSLPKNSSHHNLRKNHSAHALARNVSHPALKRIGLAPAPKPKGKEKKDSVFQLGDHSSDDEDEGEWEDSNTQSPEMTRNNSKTSTPARAHTPNGDEIGHMPPELGQSRASKTSSPPSASLKTNNRSAPNLKQQSLLSQSELPPDPTLLHQVPRASRAPPAMSTVSAHVGPSQLVRNESSRSLALISHDDVASMNATPASMKLSATASGPASGLIPASSSIEGGVSHFLASETPTSTHRQLLDESDEDSPSNFLSHYKPQPSESPEKSKTLHKARLAQNPSRTQQKLELQRREIMRAGAATPTTPPPAGMGLPLSSSSAALHGRGGSRNRNRSLAGELKAVKQDYDTAVKQLTVVRRFRNPMTESIYRLKGKNALPQDIGVVASSGALSKRRPQSRRGLSAANANSPAKAATSGSLEDNKPAPGADRSGGGSRAGRVHFQRQTSHDDIEVTPSQGSLDGMQDDDQYGLSPHEALIRRIWDSREVYDAGESVQA